MELTGNTCFVTGGSAGIGLALATALADAGNEVVICGRNEERLAEAKREHPALVTRRCDVSDEKDVRDTVAFLASEHPSVNVLINNAAMIESYRFHEHEAAFSMFEREMHTNVLAPMRLTAALLPMLLQQPRAALINVTTGTAWVPMPAVPGYSASKAAMHSLSQSLRYQLRDTNVQVFEVIPPLVDTAASRRVALTDGNTRMMSTDALSARVLEGLARDELEMRIGMNWVLWVLHRIWPSMALRALANASRGGD